MPAELYSRAVNELGEKQLIELVAVAGHYCLVELVIGAFGVPRRTTRLPSF
jgi:hypothetical protein